jgi:cyclopropane fatty-acyl-phospholipid synthase-like methyltransferase
VGTRAEAATLDRFAGGYERCCDPAVLAVERAVLGTDVGSSAYTTREQADELARLAAVGPDSLVADLGAGSGWPGLHLARTTGCRVVGTDLPLAGLRQARDRSRRDGTGERTGWAVATGRFPPLRPGAFDAVVHSDVLCCLAPKLAVLRASRRLLRAGGRIAFTTIWVAPGLDAGAHRRAVRAGPWHVASRRPYVELLAQAGFVDVVEHDVSEAYADTQRAWCEAEEAQADELRRLLGDDGYEAAQVERRRTRAAIAEGLLGRSVLAASAP